MKRNTTDQPTEPILAFDCNGYCEISEDDFATLFRPLRNHLNPIASFDWGDGYGTLFETFGEELEFIKQQSSRHIWTLVSGDMGDYIASGVHFVNSIGYFLCEVATPEEALIDVLPTEVDY